MVKFKRKNIISVKSLGEDLRKARRRFNLSLLAVEKKIGIDTKYLEALESNSWELIPGEVYAKNWLKKYSSFLGLNWEEIKLKFDKEIRKQKIWPYTNKEKFGVIKKRLIIFPKLLKSFVLVLLTAIIIGYISWQLWALISPPQLKVVYPQDNYITKSRFVKILGKAEAGAWLGLNDKEIAADSQGWFKVDIDLNKGLNVIKIEARKRYGRTKTVYRKIIVK